MSRASLRTRLFAAIVLIVVLSVGLALVLGAVLTRQAVERTAQRNLARQADLIAAREREQCAAFARDEQVCLRCEIAERVPLDRAASQRRADRERKRDRDDRHDGDRSEQGRA